MQVKPAVLLAHCPIFMLLQPPGSEIPGPACKSLRLEGLPRTLLLHVKRFSFDGAGACVLTVYGLHVSCRKEGLGFDISLLFFSAVSWEGILCLHASIFTTQSGPASGPASRAHEGLLRSSLVSSCRCLCISFLLLIVPLLYIKFRCTCEPQLPPHLYVVTRDR